MVRLLGRFQGDPGHAAVEARYNEVDEVYAEARDHRLLGFVLVLFSDCILFSSFIFAYLYLRTSAPAWPCSADLSVWESGF